MEKHRVPCMYYPSTCLIIDDQRTFLDNIIFKIDPHFICKTFTDPHDALRYIQKSRKNEFLSPRMSTDLDAHDHIISSTEIPLHFDIADLYKHIYDTDRFSEISVVVIDFQMPIMDGAEFCRKLQKIKGNNIKIIMLTGEMDEHVAIQLFNESIIHQFIRKGDPLVYDILNQSIKEMARLYFQTSSDFIIDGLSSSPDSCINDLIFIEVFEKIYKKTRASSYYLIEPPGSYLFIDDDKTATWFIVKTQHELNDFAEQMQDFGIEAELVNQVKEGVLIPYFYNFTNCMAALEKKREFKKYLLSAEKKEGSKNFSYSIVTQLPEFPLNLKKIISYKNFILK